MAERARSARRETKPLFLQDYWQRVARAGELSDVRSAGRQGSSSTELELVDLDSVESLESVESVQSPSSAAGNERRDPMDSLIVSLGQFEEDDLAAAPESAERLDLATAGSQGAGGAAPPPAEEPGAENPARETGEYLLVVAEPPSEREEAVARMSGDGVVDPDFAQALGRAAAESKEGGPAEGVDREASPSPFESTALRGPEIADGGGLDGVEALEVTRLQSVDAGGLRGGPASREDSAASSTTQHREREPSGISADGLDAKSTAQFTGLVFQDEGDTSIWDFSNTSIRRREGTEDAGRTVAGRYRLVEDVASGGMARIFRVRHLDLGKEFALKIIHDDLSGDRQMRKSFIREARVASMLNHPNIVQVTDFGVDDEHGAFIVMEYLRGETLHDRLLREGRLRPALALDIALQVAEALHYMHQQNIIHCDIKPENIFLSRPPGEGRRRVVVKLIDFGLSRREALGAQLASSEVGGTPHFMSPEQIRGLAPQPSMDIYSLGVLLYEMLVGELPFDGDLNQILAAQLHEEPVPPSRRMEAPLDEYVDRLILRALHKDPAERQPSMGQMIFEIRTVMQMLGYRSRRPVADRRRPSQREPDDLDERLSAFQNAPVPLFRVDTEPKVLAANQAFQVFVAGNSKQSVVGRPLDTTRLGSVYPNLREEILAAAMDRAPIQRVLTFRKGKGDNQLVSVLIWLVPEVEVSTGTTTFVGVILPANLPIAPRA